MLPAGRLARAVVWPIEKFSLHSVRHCTTAATQSRPLSVHVLGVGATGCLTAYYLERAARAAGKAAQLTLQLRRPPQESLIDAKGDVNIVVRNSDESLRGSQRLPWQVPGSTDAHTPIDILVITTKADQAVEAVRPLASRLTDESRACPATIVLVQNGVGVDDELIKTFGWSDDGVGSRVPFIVRGINTNGAYARKRFETFHSKGAILLGLSAQTAARLGPYGKVLMNGELLNEQSSPELSTIHEALQLFRDKSMESDLGISFVANHLDFDILQQRKLVANCVINPLTALYDLQNGEMRTHEVARASAEEIVLECYHILQTLYQAKGLVTPEELSPDSLRAYTWNIVDTTRTNYSSTVQDMWTARGSTEIDYFNGTMVRWAEALDLAAPRNQDMVDRMHVKAQEVMNNGKGM